MLEYLKSVKLKIFGRLDVTLVGKTEAKVILKVGIRVKLKARSGFSGLFLLQ